MRLGVMVVLALLGGAGCKKKPALVRTPVSQLDPLGTGIGAAPVGEDNGVPSGPQTVVLQPEGPAPDGGAAHQKIMVAPKTTNTPSVASPYVPGGGPGRLPLWKQRAKFY
jgi:hypothetical protein